MFIGSMYQWWYQRGWMAAFRSLIELLQSQLAAFSVRLLLRTLFAPWKQTVNVPTSTTPLNIRFQWWLGNQVSRFIGFMIRFITLIIAASVLALTAVLGAVLLALWFLLPPLGVLLIVQGVITL